MSAARIDHAYEARDCLDKAEEVAHTDEFAVADLNVKAAQVHATLALVEQQRIVNLIALAEHAQRRYGNYAGEAGGVGTIFSYGETPESNMRVREDIREALGLS